MKNLFIDFDGVICDTIPPIYEYLESIGLGEADEYTRGEALVNFDFKKVVNKNTVINDGIKCIKKIIDSNKFYVNILTHINSLEEGIIKTEFIRKHFKNVTMILVPKKISKTKMVHSENSILIDDYAGNLREWENAGGIPVRFSTKLNGKGYKVINKLDQIINMF